MSGGLPDYLKLGCAAGVFTLNTTACNGIRLLSNTGNITSGSFALYGLLRKMVSADAVTGLGIETMLLFPLAILWLAGRFLAGEPVMGSTETDHGLLVLAGIVSTTPLLLFTAAARRLPYSTLGMLQFLAPTLQFLIAVLLYNEPFTPAHAIAFVAIWSALALYVVALLRAPRLPQAPE